MRLSQGAHGNAAFPGGFGLPPHRRIFTNRNLRLRSITTIGFDMDHTLAVYNTDSFGELCFELAVDRLVAEKGYPEVLRSLPYDKDAAIRGLIVDKRLGNLLKVDAFRYVSRVRHGGDFLDREDRRTTYKRGRILTGSNRYRVFDTLFDLPEGCLYAALIDLKDRQPQQISTSYRLLFNDIRETVDTIHADGTLKKRVMADLGRYFIKDPDLAPTLNKFREAGKRLFLLTNSEVEYTAAVMSHLLDGADRNWEDIFDLVVCSSGKPDFFVSRGGGKPVSRRHSSGLDNREGNCFTGGDAFFLESKIGAFGDAILYFGDHTYGDILRSKKSVGWRTAMIIPEIEQEVRALLPLHRQIRALAELEEHLDSLVLERDDLLTGGGTPPNGMTDAKVAKRISRQLSKRAALQKKIAGAYNPYWGSLFKEGRAASRFGEQVTDFACIYTSRVSNFLHYPVEKFFAKPAEVLPHERWASAPA